MKIGNNESLFPSPYKEMQDANVLPIHAKEPKTEDKFNERTISSAADYQPIKLPNLSFKPKRTNELEINHKNHHNAAIS